MVIAALGFYGPSARAADAAHGGDLAKRWCAACHLVEGKQKQANADLPSFAMIAARPDFSPDRVAYFLLDPHPKMPSFSLSRSEVSDITAYINSLRR